MSEIISLLIGLLLGGLLAANLLPVANFLSFSEFFRGFEKGTGIGLSLRLGRDKNKKEKDKL